MDAEREALVGTEILTFTDGGTWVACWRRFDLVAQGPSEGVAVERLLHTMSAQCLSDGGDGRRPFENVTPPPSDLVIEWERRHAVCHRSPPKLLLV